MTENHPARRVVRRKAMRDAADAHDAARAAEAERRAAAQRSVAEAAIFGSGRPVVVCDVSEAGGVPLRLDRILIAWDGGRAAARAVADAMPVLAAALDVQILTIVGLCGCERRRRTLHGVDPDQGRPPSQPISSRTVLPI